MEKPIPRQHLGPPKAREDHEKKFCTRLGSHRKIDIVPTAPKTARKGSKNAKNSQREQFVTTLKWMKLSRILEEKLASLYRAGKVIGGVYLGKGQEAFSASLPVFLNQQEGDVYGPLIRDMAGRLAFGERLMDPVRTYLGSAQGPMRGRDGNIHRGRPRDGMPAMISHLGAMISLVNGMLTARRMQGKTGFVGGACIGDGATSTGAFHEAVNQAAVEKLPLVIAVANNQYAYSTPNDRQFACKDLVDRAKGYGIRGHSCDGTNLEDCLRTFQDAVKRARAGEGPQMVVGSLLRLSGHGEHDPAGYIPEKLKKSKIGKDCIDAASEQLIEKGWGTEDDLEEWHKEAVRKVDSSVAKALKEAKPDGGRENWYALSTKHLCEGAPETDL